MKASTLCARFTLILASTVSQTIGISLSVERTERSARYCLVCIGHIKKIEYLVTGKVPGTTELCAADYHVAVEC